MLSGQPLISDRVRITILRTNPIALTFSNGGNENVCRYRASVLYRAASGGQSWDALVDTGAVLTLFPQHVWKHFPSQDVEISSTPKAQLPDWLRYVNPVGGSRKSSRIECVVARVRCILLDEDMRVLGPFHVIAKCAMDRGAIKQTLFGLGGGSIQGKRLIIEPDLDLDGGWLIDGSSSFRG